MKMNIDWKALGKQLWAAVKPVLLAAIGGGVVSLSSGCSSLATTPRGQTTEIIAVGVPAVAWISHTSQDAVHSGSDSNGVTQANSTMINTDLTK